MKPHIQTTLGPINRDTWICARALEIRKKLVGMLVSIPATTNDHGYKPIGR